MPSPRSFDDLRIVFALKSRGLTDREISHRSGVPVTTIRGWRNRGLPRYASPFVGNGRHYVDTVVPDPSQLPRDSYAYLLGIYLGDGCLTRNGRSWTLRVVLDDAYPGIVSECCDAIESVRGIRPKPRTNTRGQRCVHVESTWYPWIHLFPQHAPGKKHHRRIALVDWQQRVVHDAPQPFLRALIHTDGWRGLNRVNVKGRDYAYPRYQFSNRSDDIRTLFTDACDRVSVAWRPWGPYHISVAQRHSVARLDSFIGPKH